jgi:hypothetical protein
VEPRGGAFASGDDGPCPAVVWRVRGVKRSWRETNARDWDDFVCRTGGSFLGAFSVLRLHRWVSRVQLFDFDLITGEGESDVRIGCCAIAVRKCKITFLDRIHLLPEYRHLWSACFKALVETFGERDYVYGSLWNQEVASPLYLDKYDILRAPEKHFHIDLIDSAQWPDFEKYFHALSKTIRHDYQRAQRSGRIIVDIRSGRRAFLLLRDALGCREQVKQKNGGAFDERRRWLHDYAMTALKVLLFGDRGIIAVARRDDECLAAFVGIEFSNRLYHITGGTKPNKEGTGSFLMLSIMERLYQKFASPHLVLGFTVGDKEPQEYDSGAHLYSRKIRATALPGVSEKITIWRWITAALSAAATASLAI